ncbi:hypothetical protein Bca52824_091540 [Brassica carinata]|uniref:Uncharacterized protein n=1 Tax=Brassica carinata TaxID=52824 RepID=A0A8X7TG11_BRACI|nr:hypothetical protein Bca52824_091540 [Brassica carinata]
MSSVGSSFDSSYRDTKQRGIPKRCNCGKAVDRFTSRTAKIRRLFHCCPMGSEKVCLYSCNCVIARI